MKTLILLLVALATPAAAQDRWMLKVDGYVQIDNHAYNPPKKTTFVRHTVALPMGSEAGCEKAIKGGMGLKLGDHLKAAALPLWKPYAKGSKLSITTLAYCKRDQF